MRYTFTSTRREGTNNDGYLDEAFVRIWDERCYADSVQRYDPLFGGGVPPDPELRDAIRALGPDDYTDSNPAVTFVTLAQGGVLELGFTNNSLTNSGDAHADLHIFEIGPDVEATFVAIRPTHATAELLGPGGDANDDGFYEIGQVAGSTSAIDLDAFFPGYPPGQLRFTSIQLIDDPNQGDSGPPSGGADIDAVCALASAPDSVPATSGYGMLSGALLILALGVRQIKMYFVDLPGLRTNECSPKWGWWTSARRLASRGEATPSIQPFEKDHRHHTDGDRLEFQAVLGHTH